MAQQQSRPHAPAEAQLTSAVKVAPAGLPSAPAPVERPRASLLERLQNSRNGLGFAFMLPAGVLLLLFLSYPLGLGLWLGFTDTKIGRGGIFIGLENYIYLAGDSVAQLALFNTMFYTAVASVLKFLLGLWLALLLNRSIRHTTFLRAVVLLPWIVPTALVGDRLLVDLRRAVLHHQLGADEARVHRQLHRLPR